MDAEVIVIGAGVAGLATAARLQTHGVATLVLEAHGQVGGCAGFFRQAGFSFDVGTTTFVDFEPGGIGGEFLAAIGLPGIDGELLPGYRAWLPDRTLTLYRDPNLWRAERLSAFGDTPAHRRFWALLDELAETFWAASRAGIRMPIHSPSDLLKAALLIPPGRWPLVRYLTWSVADALQAYGVAQDKSLTSLLAMLLQDTVHSSPAAAPLINGALGVTIRGAGLTRPRGGARGFWRMLTNHYRTLGGQLRVGTRVEKMFRTAVGFTLHTRRGNFSAPQVVSSLTIWDTTRLGLPEAARALAPYLERDTAALGGAIVVFLGVPEKQVTGQPFTHHQILVDYEQPLKNGNNMFISVSAPGDTESAPAGWRAVMLSTHCELDEWENLSPPDYAARKTWIGERLLNYARRVYPNLGEQARVFEIGTPQTYSTYTHRYRGAVGGIRLNLRNSNQFAVPYNLGIPGFWQAGDTTWPGLGTVACVLGSRHVAEAVCEFRKYSAKYKVSKKG